MRIITVDTKQWYYQISVRECDVEKLACFAPNNMTYVFTVIPFGPVNAPPFYTAMIRIFQAEWMHLFQFYYNNIPSNVHTTTCYPPVTTPLLPKSSDPKEYPEGLFLPNVVLDPELVLDDAGNISEPRVQEIYTATMTLK